MLVYFGYPAADEHDTEQAVRADLAILDPVRTLKAGADVTLRTRVGIATGLVIVCEPLGTCDTGQRVATGGTPNLPARLQAAAPPGEVAIAASTWQLVGRMFDCRALSAIEVKGLSQPVEAWQVRGEKPPASAASRRVAPVRSLHSLAGAGPAVGGCGASDRRDGSNVFVGGAMSMAG